MKLHSLMAIIIFLGILLFGYVYISPVDVYTLKIEEQTSYEIKGEELFLVLDFNSRNEESLEGVEYILYNNQFLIAVDELHIKSEESDVYINNIKFMRLFEISIIGSNIRCASTDNSIFQYDYFKTFDYLILRMFK